MGALRDFVADLMERDGSVTDPVEPDGLDVMPTDPVRKALGWPEFARLGFGAELPKDAIPIRLEGDWLDRFGGLLGERGRIAERQLVLGEESHPPGDPQRLIDRALQLPNAVWRLAGSKPTWTRCLLLAFRYTAISDEKREGLFWLGINCGTGAALDQELLERMRHCLAGDPIWHQPEPDIRRLAGPALDGAVVAKHIHPLLEQHVRDDLEPFLRAMRRRLERDCGRVHEYHDDLRRSALGKLATARLAKGDKAAADATRETLRVAAIEREYAAKLDDLRHNYALRVTVDWVQGLTVFAPVIRHELLIKRRKGERLVAMDWHPAARSMDLPPCDWGSGLGHERMVCDDHLHLTGKAGQVPCSKCSKVWCRACHPDSCPRCHKTAVRPLAE